MNKRERDKNLIKLNVDYKSTHGRMNSVKFEIARPRYLLLIG